MSDTEDHEGCFCARCYSIRRQKAAVLPSKKYHENCQCVSCREIRAIADEPVTAKDWNARYNKAANAAIPHLPYVPSPVIEREFDILRKRGLLPPKGPVSMPADDKDRKAIPLVTGCMDYFPDALLEVASCSQKANEQHNPGEPLHWAREKSTDEVNTLGRHLLQRGTRDTDGIRHSAKMAWRALAFLQKEIEAEAAQDEAYQAEANRKT